MNISLYKTTDDKNKLNKKLTNKKTFECRLKGGCSVMNPSILLETTNPTIYNYIEIPEFKRFYYITSINNVNNTLWEIQAKCDVLMSYKDEIKRLKCIIDKQEHEYNTLVNGGQFPTTPKTFTEIKEFNHELTDLNGKFILTCI